MIWLSSTWIVDVSARPHRSSTQSVTESIYDHVVENGRTYHRYKEGKYMLPNDEVRGRDTGADLWKMYPQSRER